MLPNLNIAFYVTFLLFIIETMGHNIGCFMSALHSRANSEARQKTHTERGTPRRNATKSECKAARSKREAEKPYSLVFHGAANVEPALDLENFILFKNVTYCVYFNYVCQAGTGRIKVFFFFPIKIVFGILLFLRIITQAFR